MNRIYLILEENEPYIYSFLVVLWKIPIYNKNNHLAMPSSLFNRVLCRSIVLAIESISGEINTYDIESYSLTMFPYIGYIMECVKLLSLKIMLME